MLGFQSFHKVFFETIISNQMYPLKVDDTIINKSQSLKSILHKDGELNVCCWEYKKY